MTRARKDIISVEATPYYHCVSRCVRRAFLCGKDNWSGRSYEHRREWVVERLKLLSELFCIDICAYAVMSNHWHVVLRIDTDKATSLTQDQVIHRWRQLYSGNVLVSRYLGDSTLSQPELDAVSDIVECWRSRLADISWFMRCVNESISRQANKEDQCTGRFWEGRFKSQALMDEAAILACMVYVDLNPIRAGIANTPETSDFTSIQDRICEYALARESQNKKALPTHLADFTGGYRANQSQGVPFEWHEYLKLIDWTGRAIRKDKRGYIATTEPPILERLGIDEELWMLGIGAALSSKGNILTIDRVFGAALTHVA